MAQPLSAEQLARSDAFVNEIDTEIPDAQPTAAVFELIRGGDDRGVTARFEVFAADFDFGEHRGFVPSDYRYVRLVAPAPFAVTTEQGFKDAWPDFEAPQRALAGELPYDVHLQKDFAERVAVGQPAGRGGVVFDKVELAARVEGRFQTPARVRGAESGGDRDQSFFVRRQPQPGAQFSIGHQGAVEPLNRRERQRRVAPDLFVLRLGDEHRTQ